MNRRYKNLVFTDHALQRMQERGIKSSDVWATMNRPDASRDAHRNGSFVFHRNWGREQIEVVASKNEKREWVVISVWSKDILQKHKPFWLIRLIQWLLNP